MVEFNVLFFLKYIKNTFERHDSKNVALDMYPIVSTIALYKYLFIINLTASESEIDTKKCFKYLL